MCSDCPRCASYGDPCMDAFGSNADTVGGLAGRSDGFCGAVECQKSSGSLHLHFWNFVQRAHQHHSLAKIASMLEEALISTADFKQFYATLCCESYPELEKADGQMDDVEARWPRFDEKNEAKAGQTTQWGASRLGRVPPFIWNDAGRSVADLHGKSSEQAASTWSALLADATKYESEFNAALQENQMCVQHHIHPRNRKTGARYLPNACKNIKCKERCRYDFPQESRMHSEAPLLVCKGIAEAKGLPTSGSRSTLGSILGRRNNPWLNGTAPGLCVGLTGGNTDVKLNDLLPITAATHEGSECQRGCIPHDNVTRRRAVDKMVRRLQALQSQRNGYFGGYISKRQKVGRLETRKCVEKMYALRAKIDGRAETQQQRAVTGRMITDIEMNGTLRGAVEEFNLCANLRANDVLFAECIRTFPTVDMNGQQWLHRLEVELEHTASFSTPVPVPPTRKPHARSLRSKAPWVDLYGFRPLTKLFRDLSPFEFMQHFQGVALAPPAFDEPEGRTKWTPAGATLWKMPEYKEGKIKIMPGKHYHVVEPTDDDDYYAFPTSPAHVYEVLRHSWILERRRRPHVPVLEGVQLPSPSRSAEDNAKFLSVFFRPWTLLRREASAVLHLSELGRSVSTENEVRAPSALGNNFAKAWEQYVDGNVVSQTAARLIRSVMTKTLVTKQEDGEQASDADGSDVDEEILPLSLEANHVRTLLLRSRKEDAGEDGSSVKRKRFRGKQDHEVSLQIVDALWGQADASTIGGALNEQVQCMWEKVKLT